MILHTMLVRFADEIPDAELDQFLADIRKRTEATGALRAFSAQRHLRVPGEEQIPAFIATAVVQLTVADLDGFGALLGDPAVGDVFATWRTRRPFDVAWVNHEALT
jgi:hypothetical protein